MNRPKVAIIDANTLAVLGLKQMLQTAMPIMTVDTFGSFAELEANHPEQYFHYFVAMNIVLEHKAFFLDQQRRNYQSFIAFVSMCRRRNWSGRS